MRVGEAISLDRDDVDLDVGVLTIYEAKLRRVRLVPLHQTSSEALRHYANDRDRLCTRPKSIRSSGQPPAQRSTTAAYGEPLRRAELSDRGAQHEHSTENSRSQAQLCCQYPDRLAASRRRCRRAYRGALELPRSCGPGGTFGISPPRPSCWSSRPSVSTSDMENGNDRARSHPPAVLH